MKNIDFRRFICVFLFITLGIVAFCQTKTKSPKVTPTMAKKIGLCCRNNPRMLSLFASANAEVVQNRRDVADRILAKLDNHLDYAENFILDLYYNYGTEMAYFALKNAGFTIQEHDTADAIWKKAQEKQKQIEKKRQQEKMKADLVKEQGTFDLAINGGAFSFHALSNKPEITLDMADMARCVDGFRNDKRIAWDENIDYTFNCIISKDKTLELIPEDSIAFTSTQKVLWEYIKSNAIVQNHATIQFNQLDTTLIVSAKANLRITQKSTRYRTIIEFNASKDKKTKKWNIANPDELKRKLNNIDRDNAESMYYDIEGSLYYNPYLESFEKGKYLIKAVIVENSLEYYVENKLQEETSMNFSFEFSCNKKNFMDRVYQAPN
ncbi:hypothetical protein HC965_01265 [Bacteroides sp. GM023]|nr:hypothetical protein [Bacteroides sp. GM023]